MRSYLVVYVLYCILAFAATGCIYAAPASSNQYHYKSQHNRNTQHRHNESHSSPVTAAAAPQSSQPAVRWARHQRPLHIPLSDNTHSQPRHQRLQKRFLKNILNKGKQLLNKATSAVKSTVSKVANKAKAVVNKVASTAKNVIGKATAPVAKAAAATAAAKPKSNAARTPKPAAPKKKSGGGIGGFLGGLKKKIGGVVGGIKKKVQGAVSGIKKKVQGAVTGIKQKVSGVVNKVKDVVKNPQKLINGIKQKVGGVVGQIKQKITNVKQKVGGIVSGIKSAVKQGPKGIINGLKKVARKVATTVVNKGVNLVKGTINKVKTGIVNTVTQIKDKVVSGINKVKKIGRGIVNVAKTAVSTVKGGVQALKKGGIKGLAQYAGKKAKELGPKIVAGAKKFGKWVKEKAVPFVVNKVLPVADKVLGVAQTVVQKIAPFGPLVSAGMGVLRAGANIPRYIEMGREIKEAKKNGDVAKAARLAATIGLDIASKSGIPVIDRVASVAQAGVNIVAAPFEKGGTLKSRMLGAVAGSAESLIGAFAGGAGGGAGKAVAKGLTKATLGQTVKIAAKETGKALLSEFGIKGGKKSIGKIATNLAKTAGNKLLEKAGIGIDLKDPKNSIQSMVRTAVVDTGKNIARTVWENGEANRRR
ncbi:hypothetical protein GQ42DRAFT_161128 [Ramicandelaber brevisporus]|nr:hypothetical protein GQ42DRAFT_161128 [Ramicandelaber brevisporus]